MQLITNFHVVITIITTERQPELIDQLFQS